jgi:hypothetical protein
MRWCRRKWARWAARRPIKGQGSWAGALKNVSKTSAKRQQNVSKTPSKKPAKNSQPIKAMEFLRNGTEKKINAQSK